MAVTAATLRAMRRMVVDLAAITDAHRRELTTAYVNAWDTVVAQLTDVLTQLAQDGITPARIQRSERVALALEAIAKQLDDLAALSGVVIADAAGHVVSLAAEAQAAIVGSQLPTGIRLADLLPHVVETITHRTATQITARTRPLADAGQQAVRQALIRGAASTDNPVKVARDMVRTARQGFVDLPLWRAEAISRTELLDAARATSQAYEEMNSSVIAGWVWLSSRGVNTCPACWSQDGTLHEITEPGPDGHVNCRCSRMTVTKTWRQLGINLPEPAGLDRGSAEDAFRALSRADQLKVMGKARLDALDNGAPWSSLSYEKPNAGWRRSFQVTPIRDLVGV